MLKLTLALATVSLAGAAIANDAAPAKEAPKAVPAATAKAPKTPTADDLVAELRAMPAEKRADMKAKAEQAKQQFPMIKGMLAAQAGNDPDAKDMIDTMENMMKVSTDALDLADKADAAKAAGDKAKQDEADKALKACAEKMIELQKKGMALSAKLQAKKAAAPAGQPE